MRTNYIRVLGSADWYQTRQNDHSCYTVDDKFLIDACPGVVTHLLDHGVDPLDVPVVCFTHMHCDHYMGLAPLLHYWRVCKLADGGSMEKQENLSCPPRQERFSLAPCAAFDTIQGNCVG